MKILITGSLGQLGSELSIVLKKLYGQNNIVITDIKDIVKNQIKIEGPFYQLDCRDTEKLAKIVKKEKIDRIYHLAALLSAVAEKKPQDAWNINVNCLLSVLEVSREYNCSVFIPSSIAAFGPNTPNDYTPQDTIQQPTSMYGITKVTGELLCNYYYHKYGVDTRGVRYPGIISSGTFPGGGTTDYAVEIFYEAIRKKHYTCYLKGDTYLDMIYMPDAIKAAVDIMDADPSGLRHRNAFNVTSMSFSPEDLAAYIRKYIPEFEISYNIDPVRQAIANSWPNMLEDYAARVEWGWSPQYDIDSMTRDMLEKLQEKGV